jgi:hypothetical protein
MRIKQLRLIIVIFFILINLFVLTSCSAIKTSNSSTTQVTDSTVDPQNIDSTVISETGIKPYSTQTVQLGITASQPITTPDPTQMTIRTDWKNLPVIPLSINQETLEIYKKGRENRLNPYSFSVVGDCESSASWFLGDFDLKQNHYNLGQYEKLQTVINAFMGSFSRKSLAVGNGFNSASILSPFWADPNFCNPGETPLDCEIRNHHPSFVFILLGTNDIYNLDSFEANMRIIISNLIDKGIVPILATKADNLEGNYQINEIISNLSYEYEIPLWNFWLAVQPLTNHGLQGDNAHLTWAKNDFSDPIAMDKAWPWRNLTALQILDLLLKSVY